VAGTPSPGLNADALDAPRETRIALVPDLPIFLVSAGKTVGVMDPVEWPEDLIDHIRCPRIQGLPHETIHLLHKSLVHIVNMRRSIERANLQRDRSILAALEAEQLLARLRRDGY
jgi:hypothetical protein